MQKIRPRLKHIGKILFVLVAEHHAEGLGPCDAYHVAFFVKIHVPRCGIHHAVKYAYRLALFSGCFRILLAPLYLCDIGIIAVSVLLTVLLHKGIMYLHPYLVSLRGEFAYLETVGAVLCLMIFEKIGDLIPVIGMNGVHSSAALGTDKILLRPLHHPCKLGGTPDGIICAVRLDPHHHRIVIKRIKQSLVKLRLKSFHGFTLIKHLLSFYLTGGTKSTKKYGRKNRP